MTDLVEELYDYDVLRRLETATLFVVHLSQPTLVLGGNQSRDVVSTQRLGSVALRRRRGGGGLVLLHPGDLWLDWWIPANDSRWTSDVHRSSLLVGEWWRDALAPQVKGMITLHQGPMKGNPVHRIVCFAGRGPGEVFVDDRKAVGLTQWRVREGIFLSTVMPAHESNEMVDLLSSGPAGLETALDHHTIASLGLVDLDAVLSALCDDHGPWSVRQLFLEV